MALAVAQKMWHTSGTIFRVFKTFSGRIRVVNGYLVELFIRRQRPSRIVINLDGTDDSLANLSRALAFSPAWAACVCSLCRILRHQHFDLCADRAVEKGRVLQGGPR